MFLNSEIFCLFLRKIFLLKKTVCNAKCKLGDPGFTPYNLFTVEDERNYNNVVLKKLYYLNILGRS